MDFQNSKAFFNFLFQMEKDVSKLNRNDLCKQRGISTEDRRPSKISKVCSLLGICLEDASESRRVLQSNKAEKKGWTKNIQNMSHMTLGIVTVYLTHAHDTQVDTESGNTEV